MKVNVCSPQLFSMSMFYSSRFQWTFGALEPWVAIARTYNLWVTKFFVNHNDHVHTQFVNHKIFCESQTKIKLFRILTGPWPDQTMHGPVWWTHIHLRDCDSQKSLWLTNFLCERCWDNLWFTNFRPYYLLTYIIIFATSCLSKFWFAEACINKSNLISSEFGIHPVLPYLSPRGRSRSKLSKPSFRNLFHVNGILQNDYSDNLEHNSKDKSKHTVPILARTFEIFFVAFQTNAWHYQNLHFKIRFVCKWYFAESLNCDNVEHSLEGIKTLNIPCHVSFVE